MTSAIDATKPLDSVAASKAEMRANFAAAKSEIEALQTQVGTLSPYVFSGMRNRLINGAMIFDQRNNLALKAIPAGSTGGLFGPDRWYGASSVGGGAFSMQVFSTGGPTGFPQYLRMATTTAKGALAVGDFHNVAQAVEGYHWRNMLYGTADALSAVLSFWVRASIAGTYSIALQNAAAANSIVTTYTVNTANVWEYKTLVFPGSTIGTWALTISTAIRVRFDLGSGTSFNAATAGVWSSTNRGNIVGTVSMIGTNAATLDITAVQLEPGTVVTPFDHRLATIEGLLCQRYYVFGQFNLGGVGNSANVQITTHYINPYLRDVPTITRSAESLTNFGTLSAFPTLTGTVLQGTPTVTGGWLWSGNFSAETEIV